MISTIGYSVDKKVFEAGRINKKNYKNAKGVTAKELNAKLSGLESHFATYDLETKSKPTKEELKRQISLGLMGKGEEQEALEVATPQQPTIFEYLEEFKKEQSLANEWAYGTLQCWKTFGNHLKDFNASVTLDDFDEFGITNFIVYLRGTLDMEEKTVQKQYSNLKWFLNWAIRKGYTKQDFINRYKAKFKVLEKPVIFLTKEELLKLYNYQIPANGKEVDLIDRNGKEYKKTIHDASGLAKTRDLFCFCAFTSLRYSDMANLKRHDIRDGILYITTQKTNDRIPIELNAFAKEIIDKYKKEKYDNDLALPVISNQKMNKYLKVLGELCGFNDPITRVCFRGGKRVEETYPKYEMIGTHAGRRTFICFALSSGIPPQVVMKWTGHSDYSAMKPYIDIAEKTKANAMSLFEMELKK
ncbi:MAG: phage integrase SAM-like domain-containing protein [Bacteroidales bacterium]|nr:phage integrase SAM-like domain-containing protein [Bacteroidales bacterium]